MKRCTVAFAVALGAALAACSSPPPALMDGPRPAARKQTLLFYAASTTDSPHRAILPLAFAVAAKEKGHDAVLFFAGDGTLIMKDAVAADLKAVGQPGAAQLLAKAVELKIPIHV